MPGVPAKPREALAVVWRPSFLALYEFKRYDLSTPFSMTTVRRVGTPSPSNGLVPKPPGIVPSSITVTLSPAIFWPNFPARKEAPRYTESLPSWQENRSEEHTSELQSPCNLVCRLLLEKKKKR